MRILTLALGIAVTLAVPVVLAVTGIRVVTHDELRAGALRSRRHPGRPLRPDGGAARRGSQRPGCGRSCRRRPTGSTSCARRGSPNGAPAFDHRELRHMADVRTLVSRAYRLQLVLLVAIGALALLLGRDARRRVRSCRSRSRAARCSRSGSPSSSRSSQLRATTSSRRRSTASSSTETAGGSTRRRRCGASTRTASGSTRRSPSGALAVIQALVAPPAGAHLGTARGGDDARHAHAGAHAELVSGVAERGGRAIPGAVADAARSEDGRELPSRPRALRALAR